MTPKEIHLEGKVKTLKIFLTILLMAVIGLGMGFKEQQKEIKLLKKENKRKITKKSNFYFYQYLYPIILKGDKKKYKLSSLEISKEGKLIEQTNIFGTYNEIIGVYSVRIDSKKVNYYWYYYYGK